jgi:hypothetical protein
MRLSKFSHTQFNPTRTHARTHARARAIFCPSYISLLFLRKKKVKDEVRPGTGHEDPEEE